MEIVLLANEKGGVGKTSTVLLMGNCLTALGYRVLITDTDPSGNLSAAALEGFPEHVLYDIFTGACELHEAIYETPFGDILPTSKDLAPSNNTKKSFVIHNRKNLGELFASLYGKENTEQFLSILLRDPLLANNYDFSIIDSAPAANLLITNALVAADSVIVPIEPSSASIDGFLMFLESIKEASARYKTEIKVDGLLFTKFTDKRKTRREQTDSIVFCAKNRNLYVYRNKFRDASSIETSMNNCKPILDYINYQDSGVYDSMNFTLEFLAKRGLEPKKAYPGVLKDETGSWIFRKNGNKYFTYSMENGKARILTMRLKKGDLENEEFMSAIGKTVFFDLMNLEAHLINQGIRYIPENETGEEEI